MATKTIQFCSWAKGTFDGGDEMNFGRSERDGTRTLRSYLAKRSIPKTNEHNTFCHQLNQGEVPWKTKK